MQNADLSSQTKSLIDTMSALDNQIEDNKYINLNWRDRFVQTDLLRNSYLHYDESLNPIAKTFVSFVNALLSNVSDGVTRY